MDFITIVGLFAIVVVGSTIGSGITALILVATTKNSL